MSGLPKFTSAIHRAATFAKYNLRPTETLVLFALMCSDTATLFPYKKDPVAYGDSVHVVNAATGIDLPYVIAQGYEFTWYMTWYSMTQPTRAQQLIDGQLYAEYYPETDTTDYSQYAFPFQISFADPTFASAHTIDITAENLGGEDLYGTTFLFITIEPVGTPPRPKTKTVACRSCHATGEVPVKTTVRTCPKCNAVTWYILGWGL